MFTSIEAFKQSWAHESETTRKLMSELTDKSLSQKVTNDHRNLGRIAWHIVQTIPEMAGRTGLKIAGPGEQEPVPASAETIRRAYETASKSLLDQIASNWKDETLQVQDDMYGQTWPRSLTLRALVNHEVHHRGQMTVLMRQAGLKVPGVYGPSKDEWGQYGMTPPEI